MQTNTNHNDDALVYLAVRLEENKRIVIQGFIEGGLHSGGLSGFKYRPREGGPGAFP